MAISAAVMIKLSLGLAILYGLVIVVWFELLRSLLARRRASAKAAPAPHADTVRADQGVPADQGVRADHGVRADNGVRVDHGEAPGAGENHGHATAAMESELERARRHYRLAREEARTERDAAIAAAGRAADQAIERIEGRYREIDAAFIDEETERILEMLRGPSGDERPRPADGGKP